MLCYLSFLVFPFPMRRKGDSNPRYSFPYTHFPGVRLKPLGHLSSIARTMYIWSFFVYKIHHAFGVLSNEFFSVLENLFDFYCIYFSSQIFNIQFAEFFHGSLTGYEVHHLGYSGFFGHIYSRYNTYLLKCLTYGIFPL